MAEFNYTEYLRNNPLLKKEEKQTLTEAVSKGDPTVDAHEFDFFKTILGGRYKDEEIEDYLTSSNFQDALDDFKLDDTYTSDWVGEFANYFGDSADAYIDEEKVSSKMKVSELKAKIKEDIISLLQEEEEEDVEAEIEDEVEVDVEEPAMNASDAQEGLTADEKEIQDSLKIAYDNAVAIGDTKLADQIGNSITFFTRTHVVER